MLRIIIKSHRRNEPLCQHLKAFIDFRCRYMKWWLHKLYAKPMVKMETCVSFGPFCLTTDRSILRWHINNTNNNQTNNTWYHCICMNKFNPSATNMCYGFTWMCVCVFFFFKCFLLLFVFADNFHLLLFIWKKAISLPCKYLNQLQWTVWCARNTNCY